MKNLPISTGILARILTMILSFVSNIWLLDLILRQEGPEFLGNYIWIVGLCLLVPFADLGLGIIILNHFADTLHMSQKIEVTKGIVTNSMVIVAGFCLITWISMSVVICLFQEIISPLSNSSRNSTFAIIFILIWLTATPFSLGARKLQAEGLSHYVIIGQALIPFITFALSIFCLKIMKGATEFVLLAPAISYLISTVIIFLKSRLAKFLDLSLIGSLPIFSLNNWKTAFTSLVLTTSMTLIFQLPKYFFGFENNANNLVRYGVFMAFLLPALSVVSIPAAWLSPKLRYLSRSKDMVNAFMHTMRWSFFAGSLMSCGIIFVTFVLKSLGVLSLNLRELFLALILISTYPLWIVPALGLTDQKSLQSLAKISLLVLISASAFILMSQHLNLDTRLLIYFFSIILSQSLCFSRIACKKFRLAFP